MSLGEKINIRLAEFANPENKGILDKTVGCDKLKKIHFDIRKTND
jgi:hypothetical protein